MTEELEIHSAIGASKSDRWINCPGSVIASQNCIEKCTDAAALGTAAHKLGELTIEKGVKSPNEWKRPRKIKGKDQSFDVDSDMSDAVEVYTSYIHRSLPEGIKPEVEQRFGLPEIHPEMFGTNDCLIDYPLHFLHVIDYKHGKGKIVEVLDYSQENDPENGRVLGDGEIILPNGDRHYVEEMEDSIIHFPDISFVNTQLLIYALGALNRSCEIYEYVKLTIVQPRAEHAHGPIRSVVLRPSVIRRWGREVLKPAAYRCYEPNPQFKIGSWCRFCPAIMCPAVVARSTELAQISHNPILEPEKVVTFPLVTDLTPVQLGAIRTFAQHFKEWADDVGNYMKEQLRTGAMTPDTLGFKRVSGNQAKSWTPDYQKDIIEKSDGMVVVTDFFGEPPKRSPAQMDKRLQEKGLAKSARDAILNPAIIKTPGNPKLVPVTAAGVALPPDAANAFETYNESKEI